MNRRGWWMATAQFAGIGWFMAAAIVMPTLGGRWLDGRAGTTPLFLLLGLLLGVVLALYGTYRMAAGSLTGRRDSGEPKGPEP